MSKQRVIPTIAILAVLSVLTPHAAGAAEEGAYCGTSRDYFKPDPMNQSQIMRRHAPNMEANWFFSNTYANIDAHSNWLSDYTYDHMGLIGYWHDPCE